LRKLSEERTRKQMIDPQLEMAGWYLRDHSKVNEEIPVDGYKTSEVSETSEVWASGVTD
jgi:type I site-specific restriction endonuclease